MVTVFRIVQWAISRKPGHFVKYYVKGSSETTREATISISKKGSATRETKIVEDIVRSIVKAIAIVYFVSM